MPWVFFTVPDGTVAFPCSPARAVELSDPRFGAGRIRGVFSMDEAEGVLRAIAQGASISFVDEGPRIGGRRPRAALIRSALRRHARSGAPIVKVEKVEKAEKIEKVEKPEKVEKVEKPERVERRER